MNFYDIYPQFQECKKEIEIAKDLLINCFKDEKKLLVCGNGGSSSDALHIVGELQKSFSKKRPLTENQEKLFEFSKFKDKLCNNLENGVFALSLVSEAALNFAIANDIGAEFCFAQQVWATGRKGDILMCLSTSGNSKNVVLAAHTAKAKGMLVIGLTGNNKTSELNYISDVCINAPAMDTAHIQELHLPIYHYLCKSIELELF